MLWCIPIPISLLLGAPDRGGELLQGCYCGGRDRLSPVCPVSHRGFFEKSQVKSRQKAPDDRMYGLVSKCTKSFCTHSEKTEVCLSGATGAVCFSEAVKVCFLPEHSWPEACCWWQQSFHNRRAWALLGSSDSPQHTSQNVPSFLTPHSDPDSSPKPGRRKWWILCLELLCSVAKPRSWEVGRWKAVAVRGLEISELSGSWCACRIHMSGFPWRPCFKWKMNFHVLVKHLKKRFWGNKQILWCSWTAVPSLWVAEGRMSRSLLPRVRFWL